ncbi:MAG: MarR family transcriptional regulator [Planctomycetota bacterium]
MDRVERILEQWRRERPDLELRPMGVIGRLKRIAHRLDHGMSRTFRDHGLNLSSFDVLATLRRAGEPYELSPGDLLATSMVTSGTMTNRIDQLEEAGLVERRENPTDGRSVLIRLTADGLTVIDDALSDHVATQTRLMSGLSDAELTRLDRLLRRFLIALEGDAEEPTR